MAIRILPEADVHVTAGELERYREQYDQTYRMYSGPRPTLEEFIRAQKAIKVRRDDFRDGFL